MINRQSQNGVYRQGFTLIEILIVVVILGILASVVIAQFRNASDDAVRATFLTNGKTFIESAMRFKLYTGQFLEDSSSGAYLPASSNTCSRRTGSAARRSAACGTRS